MPISILLDYEAALFAIINNYYTSTIRSIEMFIALETLAVVEFTIIIISKWAASAAECNGRHPPHKNTAL